jgi:hypothetical protein
MIPASPWNYATNFFNFARGLVRALSEGDFGAAFSGLDQSGQKWSRDQFQALLRRHEMGSVTSPDGHPRSAAPILIPTKSNDVFEVLHRLAIDGKWADTAVHLRFSRAKGEYFKVELLGLQDLRLHGASKPPLAGRDS